MLAMLMPAMIPMRDGPARPAGACADAAEPAGASGIVAKRRWRVARYHAEER